MNCINVIPVVKVGLEVEFLSGSGRFVLSFSRKLEPHRDYREERAEIKGAEKRWGTGMKKGGDGRSTNRENSGIAIERTGSCSIVAGMSRTTLPISNTTTQERERERESVCARWYVCILHAEDLVWSVSEWTMNLHERRDIRETWIPGVCRSLSPSFPPSQPLALSLASSPVSRHWSGMYTD